jgi:hypothetical protein
MPASQAMLLWVKDVLPKRFSEVLEKAKANEANLHAAEAGRA